MSNELDNTAHKIVLKYSPDPKILYAIIIIIYIIHFILFFPCLGNMNDDSENEILADVPEQLSHDS